MSDERWFVTGIRNPLWMVCRRRKWREACHESVGLGSPLSLSISKLIYEHLKRHKNERDAYNSSNSARSVSRRCHEDEAAPAHSSDHLADDHCFPGSRSARQQQAQWRWTRTNRPNDSAPTWSWARGIRPVAVETSSVLYDESDGENLLFVEGGWWGLFGIRGGGLLASVRPTPVFANPLRGVLADSLPLTPAGLSPVGRGAYTPIGPPLLLVVVVGQTPPSPIEAV